MRENECHGRERVLLRQVSGGVAREVGGGHFPHQAVQDKEGGGVPGREMICARALCLEGV